MVWKMYSNLSEIQLKLLRQKLIQILKCYNVRVLYVGK